MISRKISIAPMMKCTDRHFRYFMRLITKKTLLYTEMISTDAILHGNREWLLAYDPVEHPLAIQLGGNDPKKLAQCAKIAEDYGYDEVNLNVGCPSDRVRAGRFGACLMKEPLVVAECVRAMKSSASIPVTVKCRIGVDDLDSYAYLYKFVKHLVDAGVDALIVHARKAWLKGLSPKDNRTIPPLQYETVCQLKRDFSDVEISINGGINTLTEIETHLTQVDGVMIGRAAYNNPFIFADVDEKFFEDAAFMKSRQQVVTEYLPYLLEQYSKGISIHKLSKHIMGVFHGMPNGKQWRQFLSTALAQSSDPEKLLIQKSQALT